MPYRIFLLLRASVRADRAVGWRGDGVDIGAGLVEKVYPLDDVSVLNTRQVRARFLVFVLLAHVAADY